MKLSAKARCGAAGAATAIAVPLILGSPAHAANVDQNELTQLATHYLQSRLGQVTDAASATAPAALSATPMTAQFAARVRDETAELTRLRKDIAGTAAEYRSATVKLLNPEVTVSGDTVRMAVEERARLAFADPGTYPGAAEASSYRVPHVMTFQRHASSWTLTSDALDIPANAPDPTFYVNPVKLKAPTLDNVSHEPLIQDGLRPNYPGAPHWSSGPARHNASPATVSIDRQAAVDYAHRYVYDYNPVYERFGNDCANFVSQSLRAGGWQDVGHGDDDADKWWQFLIRDTVPVHSKTWSVSQDLEQFGFRYSHRMRSYAGESPRIADVVFADWENGTDGHLDHSMIVTGNAPGNVDDWSKVKVTYHSNDELDIPMSVVNDRASHHGTTATLYYFMDTAGY